MKEDDDQTAESINAEGNRKDSRDIRRKKKKRNEEILINSIILEAVKIIWKYVINL